MSSWFIRGENRELLILNFTSTSVKKKQLSAAANLTSIKLLVRKFQSD